MEKVIIYGNCHVGVIMHYLKSSVEFCKRFQIINIPLIQEIYSKSNDEIDNIPFEECDVFIHQEIQINNRYGVKYASENIIKRLKPTCRIIAIPNLYGLPLYLFPQCNINSDIKYRNSSFGFKDAIVENAINDGYGISEIIESYEDELYYSQELIDKKYRLFLEKVQSREKKWDIKICKYLEKNKCAKLFFDPNHPSNTVLEYVVYELCNILDININVRSARGGVRYQLDSYEIPLCASVRKYLNLNSTKDINYIRKSCDARKMISGEVDLQSYIEQYLVVLWLNGELVDYNRENIVRIYNKYRIKELLSNPVVVIKRAENKFLRTNQHIITSMLSNVK